MLKVNIIHNRCFSALLLIAGSLCSAAALAAAPQGRGIIIPAYIGLSDLKSWNILQEGALIMANGQNPSIRNYWVVVNSGTNGPFLNASDWSRAADVWNPIRKSSGKIFGYVHTCFQPDGSLFRPLSDIKTDIINWVNGYPDIDGIWIDEFYPRYEIADADNLTGPNYPNGIESAPKDRGFVNNAGQFNGQQVNPAGGFYDKLTTWIRATYPQLKIIGNAGGALYSNQLMYGNIPDVLVSFEQNYSVALNAPVNDWSGLTRQIKDSKSGQLALVHRNSSNLNSVVDQAFSHGFTHVFTTDRKLENNVWGGLPPYLSTEIKYIADHP